MITGAVRFDLTMEPGLIDNRDRRVLAGLSQVPDGARAVVDIGSRQYITEDAAAWLHAHADRLLIEIQGTNAAAVRTFVAAGRAGGAWSVVA